MAGLRRRQLYTLILKFNQLFNRWRARAGLPYWSLSQYLKLKVKNAVNYISSFEEALAAEASKSGLDGVVCGHIHKPEIREHRRHHLLQRRRLGRKPVGAGGRAERSACGW